MKTTDLRKGWEDMRQHTLILKFCDSLEAGQPFVCPLTHKALSCKNVFSRVRDMAVPLSSNSPVRYPSDAYVTVHIGVSIGSNGDWH